LLVLRAGDAIHPALQEWEESGYEITTLSPRSTDYYMPNIGLKYTIRVDVKITHTIIAAVN
jgi:hypothetical protein